MVEFLQNMWCGYNLREKREYTITDWKIQVIIVALIALIFISLYFNGNILDTKNKENSLSVYRKAVSKRKLKK